MKGTIYKFEQDMLHGENIRINIKQDPSWYKKHWHNYYEIICYRGCRGVCILNGEKYPIKDNCLFLLTPKDFHEIHTENNSDAYSYIIAFNEQIADKSILYPLTKGPFVAYDISSELLSKIHELYEAFNSDKQYRNQYIKHLFNCILLEILDNADEAYAAGKDISPIVRDSISVMLADPTFDFSLGYFANMFNITTAYFSRLFHRHTGVSFKQYLTSLRLEYAKQLLDENTMPIIDIGYECGFNTPSQFYRAFKTANSVTPSEYRRIIKHCERH